MDQEINFVGNGKENGNRIQIVLRWDSIVNLPRWKNKQGKEYLSLNVIQRQEVSQWGHTHAVIEYQKPVAVEG